MDKLPWVGVSVSRKEDERLLRGAAGFIDDLDHAPALHAAVLRCPYPHARVRAIDPRAALATPGVEAVIVSSKNEVLVSNGIKGRLTVLSTPTDAP